MARIGLQVQKVVYVKRKISYKKADNDFGCSVSEFNELANCDNLHPHCEKSEAASSNSLLVLFSIS